MQVLLLFSFSFFLSFLEGSNIPFILVKNFLTPSLILSPSLPDEFILSFVLLFFVVIISLLFSIIFSSLHNSFTVAKFPVELKLLGFLLAYNLLLYFLLFSNVLSHLSLFIKSKSKYILIKSFSSKDIFSNFFFNFSSVFIPYFFKDLYEKHKILEISSIFVLLKAKFG